MLYIDIASHDPAFNLALEECLLRGLAKDHPGYFLLWQNGPSVIIGRHQTTIEVINPAYVNAKRLPVIRRMTGGGAVYHDLGNLNFSFIARGQGGFGPWMEAIASALRKLGCPAQITGRNDMEIEGKKFSGNSQLRLDGKILHHGTLLLDADIEGMTCALKVDEAKIRSKGVKSVASRVINLKDYLGEDYNLAKLKQSLAAACASGQTSLTAAQMEAAARLARDKYSTWEWNFGKSPACNLQRKRRFAWGETALLADIRQGRIAACAIRGDFFSSRPIGELEAGLVGKRAGSEELRDYLKSIDWPGFFTGCEPQSMEEFFREALLAGCAVE